MLSAEILNRSEINDMLWDQCIASAPNGLAYATTDFLDHMADNWEAIVVGDYEAVFPIPFRRKMGIKYVCMPAFCQQLGMFGQSRLVDEWLTEVLKKLALRYRLVEMQLNHHNKHKTSHRLHLNLLLPLHEGYQQITSGFKGDLHKNLNRSAKFQLVYEETNELANVIEKYKQHYRQRIPIRSEDFERLTDLAEDWQAEGKCIARIIRMPDSEEWLACALFLKDNKRLYNIANTTLPNGRTLEANHVLLHQLIREFAGQSLTLDFEGSDLPGVERFYRKFGPKEEWYYGWKSNRLPAVMRWWKR